MSSTESGDEPVPIPPKKRTKRNHLDVKTKYFILNLYEHEMQENPTLLVQEIAGKVAAKAQVCTTSVYRVVREYRKTHTFSAPRTNLNRKRTVDSVDEFTRNAIKRKVNQFFFKNELPTIDKVLKEVNDDPDLPNFKRGTFNTLMKTLNFEVNDVEELEEINQQGSDSASD